MLTKITDTGVSEVISEARKTIRKSIAFDGRMVEISRPFPSPEDWRDVFIYFLMIDRFNNPDAPPHHKPFDENYGGFQGGTIRGIRDKLDYIQYLGARAIWMTPVFKNCRYLDETYHGYGIQDFLSVDPRFGTEEELIELIDEAHARGIYVIFDVVINHAGDVFIYEGVGKEAPFRDTPYGILWRGADGIGVWEDSSTIPLHPDPNAAIFPDEIRNNEYFRRQGSYKKDGSELHGDFYSLKEFRTEISEDSPVHGHYFPVRDILIKAYQYAIAKFDIDGLRIDTLKHVERDFARIFGNAMREFALSIGKRNFFTFGETADNDFKIARYTGRFSSDPDDLVGVDAAIDFPLFYRLPGVLKGFSSPKDLAHLYSERKRIHRGENGHGVLFSSHGEASRFFVTFLDNHDQHTRFHFSSPVEPDRYAAQLSMALGCLFALQGIPCVYYGTEQGLHGAGDSDQSVREALWGKDNAFDTETTYFKNLREIASVRAGNPALRYGRQYFRQVSGNGTEFGLSSYAPGVIAFSRILNDTEIVVAANTSTEGDFSGYVIVDFALNPPGTGMDVLYSNQGVNAQNPGSVQEKPAGSVMIHGMAGGTSYGPLHILPVDLKPMEIQILGKG